MNRKTVFTRTGLLSAGGGCAHELEQDSSLGGEGAVAGKDSIKV